MDDDVVALRDDKLMFVTQSIGCVADQIEQSIATRFDVRAVLNVVGGPIPFSCFIVPLVESVSNASRTSALFFSCLVGSIEFFLAGRNHRGTRAGVMALIRRYSPPPGMPDAFDRAPLR